MAHNLTIHANGFAEMAFIGSRDLIWHKLGNQLTAGAPRAEWIKMAGHDWSAIPVPALAALEGDAWNHLPASERFQPVPNRFFNCRSDNGLPLGLVSDRFENHQPREFWEFMDRFTGVSDDFTIDTAGTLLGGKKIWILASHKSGLQVAGDRINTYLLATTGFDGTTPTTCKLTHQRVVCNNTLDGALMGKGATFTVKHMKAFDQKAAADQLATLAQSMDSFKAIGDAMAQVEMSKQEVSDFFKTCLDIDLTAKAEDVSTRKQNQFQAMAAAYRTTVREEGAAVGSAWAVLNAVTRYVDHDMSVRGDQDGEARLLSTQFGAGAEIKETAMGLLMPRIKDRVLIAA